MTARVFVKRDAAAPPGFFGCEAAGLQWLSEVSDGVPCARVIDSDDVSLTLERVESGRPGPATARAFGVRLAHTHDAGAAAFGAPPGRWRGRGFFGPLYRPLPMSYAGHRSWGEFYAGERLAPMLELARRGLDRDTVTALQIIMERCLAGDFDDDDGPARLHGDLWSGNLIWTDDGVVLIDPAAHGGHRETDLAMLALFGCPHLDAILAGYQSVHPLMPGWRDRIVLHQLYPLLAHVVLFGGSYSGQTHAAARRSLEIS
jgi:fructosamine-3-kinase